MKKTKLLAMLLAGTMVVSAFAGCSSSGDADSDNANTGSNPDSSASTDSGKDSKVTKDEIVILQGADIKSLDPVVSNEANTHVILRHMYNRLLYMDPQGNLHPELAEEWEQVSPTEYHFKLRQGVKFHNGDELTAEDVKFTLERCLESPRIAMKIEAISEVVIDNDYEITLKLSEPFAPLIPNLAHPGVSILNKKIVSDPNYKFDTAVGTGSMKFVEWVPNDHYTLERYEDYFEGPCKTGKLTCRVIPEGSSRTIALENGEADLVISVDAVDINRVTENTNLHTETFTGNTLDFLAFNMKQKPFDDIRVRQAINYAINKENIVDVVLEGYGVVATSVYAPTVRGFNEELTGYEYNLEKAKELMKEAGYENGFSTQVYTSGEARNRTAQLIQDNLAQIGIEVEIMLMDSGAFLDAMDNGQCPMYIYGWNCNSMDPDECIYPLFHTDCWGATGNRGFYSNPKVDELIIKARTSTDDNERMALYKEIQAMIMEDAPWAALDAKSSCVSMNKDLKGFEVFPSGAHWYNNLYYEN